MATDLDPLDATLEVRCFCGPVLLNMWHHRAPAQMTLGEARGCDVFVSAEGLPVPAFPLVRRLDDSYFLTLTDAMTGELDIGGATYPLPLHDTNLRRADPDLEGAYNVALPLHALALVHWGGVSLAMRFCEPPTKTPGAPLSGFDGAFVNSMSFALCLHVAVVAALLLQPRDVKALQPDIFTDPSRSAMLILTPPSPLPKPLSPPPPPPAHVDAPPSQRPTKPMPIAPPTVARPSMFSPKLPVAATPPAPVNSKIALFEQWLKHRAEGLKPATAPGLLPGVGPLHVPGNSVGEPLARGSVTAGSMERGMAPASVGIGDIARRGGLAPQPGILSPTHRVTAEPITLQPANIVGALEPDVIRSVIDAQRAQVRYCYEKALQRHQELAGRIVIFWIITATGTTTQVRVEESSLDDDDVGACIVERVGTWRFPQPAGGGTVQVRYPWVFRPS